MSNKNDLTNSKIVATKDQSPEALHALTRQAEQALRAQQNNQNNETKPKETKK